MAALEAVATSEEEAVVMEAAEEEETVVVAEEEEMVVVTVDEVGSVAIAVASEVIEVDSAVVVAHSKLLKSLGQCFLSPSLHSWLT